MIVRPRVPVKAPQGMETGPVTKVPFQATKCNVPEP